MNARRAVTPLNMIIHVTHDLLTVEFGLLEKIFGMHGNFTIPRAHIQSAWIGMPKTVWKELRVPGSFVPGLIKAGTYFTPRGREYWYVTRAKRHPITIELTEGNPYKRLVLGLEDPASAQSINLSYTTPPTMFETEA